jgi:hypothetical protein
MHLTRMARAYAWHVREGKTPENQEYKQCLLVVLIVDIVSCFTILRRGFAFQAVNG